MAHRAIANSSAPDTCLEAKLLITKGLPWLLLAVHDIIVFDTDTPNRRSLTPWPHLRHVTNDHGVHRLCRNPTSFKCRTRSHSTKLGSSDTFQLAAIGPKGSPPGCHDEYCTTRHLEILTPFGVHQHGVFFVCVRERPRDSYSSHLILLAYTVSRRPINKEPQLAICHNRVDPECCAHVTEDHSEEDNPFNICSRWASSPLASGSWGLCAKLCMSTHPYGSQYHVQMD